MDISNRLTRRAWAPIVIALIVACGSNDEGSTPARPARVARVAREDRRRAPAERAGASGMAGATGDGAAGRAGGAAHPARVERAARQVQTAARAKVAALAKTAALVKAALPEPKAAPVKRALPARPWMPARSGDVSMPPRPDVISDVVLPPIDGPDDLIRELVGRLRAEAFEAKCKELEAMSQPNRKTKTANYTAATEWVKGWLATEAPRAVVTFDDWSGSRNIEIKIAGTDPAAGMYVIGGHLDSVAATAGMDDDGSGSLGVAMLASAMSQLPVQVRDSTDALRRRGIRVRGLDALCASADGRRLSARDVYEALHQHGHDWLRSPRHRNRQSEIRSRRPEDGGAAGEGLRPRYHGHGGNGQLP